MLRLVHAFAEAGHSVLVFSGTEHVHRKIRAAGSPRVSAVFVGQAKSAFGALRFRHTQWDRACRANACDAVLGFNYFVPSALPQAMPPPSAQKTSDCPAVSLPARDA